MSARSELTADLALAFQLADIAADLSLTRFHSGVFGSAIKPDDSLVTDVDEEIEVALRAQLDLHRPDDGVIAEELAIRKNPTSRRQWIIDPIDATRNFATGNPEWATLIALTENGVPVLGVVSAPALDQRWWATAGNGAYTQEGNGPARKIVVSSQSNLSGAQISHAPLPDWESVNMSPHITQLTGVCRSSAIHASFLGQVWVAEGKLDAGGLDPDARQWDIAALVTILQEAGGTFTDLDGNIHLDLAHHSVGVYSRSMMATNERLLPQITEIFRPNPHSGFQAGVLEKVSLREAEPGQREEKRRR